MLSLLINFLLAINVVVSLLIILVVLMQRPKSEGLGAAFGGGMTENLFGAQTSNVLANFTRWLGGTFFFLTLILSILYAKQSTQHSAIQAAAIKAAEANPAPSASPASSTAATSGTAVNLGVPYRAVTPAAPTAPASSAAPAAAKASPTIAAATPTAAPASKPASTGTGH